MLFSVIVPIFNVAKFFNRGLETLLAQDFSDYEIILVDDGSTDDSGKLCDDAANRYENISVAHCVNSGSGPARNLGIEMAKGDYIMFFDIDDMIHADALSTIAASLQKRPVDLLIFSYREIDARTGTKSLLEFTPAELSSNSDIRNAYIPDLCGMKFNNGFVWNKVYNRLFLKENRLSFEALRIQQDEAFNLTVYPKAKRLTVLDRVLYDYFVYSSGNTRSREIPERLEIYRSIRKHFHQIIDAWNLDDIDFLLFVEERFVMSFMEFLRCNIIHSPRLSGKELRSKIEEEMSANDVQEAVSFVLSNGNTKGVRLKFFNYIERRSATEYLRTYHRVRLFTSIKGYIKRIIRL